MLETNAKLCLFFQIYILLMSTFDDLDLGKSDLQKSIEEDAKKEAVKIEGRTYDKTKAARMKLEKAAMTQKGTTDEIRKMNESLEGAKESGIKTYENAKKAKWQATKLSKENNAFNPVSGMQAKAAGWMEKDANADREIAEIKGRKNKNSKVGKETDSSTGMKVKFGKANFAEEKKTNDELSRILETVEGINKETNVQKKEGEKQSTNLQDILKTTEHAKKATDDANSKLKDFNKDN